MVIENFLQNEVGWYTDNWIWLPAAQMKGRVPLTDLQTSASEYAEKYRCGCITKPSKYPFLASMVARNNPSEEHRSGKKS